MFKLNDKTKQNIEKHLDLNIDSLKSMNSYQIDQYIEKKNNIKLQLENYKDYRLQGRGSVYIFLNRLIEITGINKYLSRIK